MPFALSCRSVPRVAVVFALAPMLATLGGCYRRPPVLGDRSAPERATGGYGQPLAHDQFRRRFPGVSLETTASGGFYLRILGGSALRGEPLYVIDGNPMLIDPGRGIDWFKPEDIVRLEVLKNPTDTAVYGPRGANGVIVLTTRQVPAPRDRER